MKNNRCLPPCLRKFHKLDCIYFRKKIEKNQQNLVPRSKSDTEIIKLIKRAWKRKSLRHIEISTLKTRFDGPLPLFNYRYDICNHNLFLKSNNVDKKETKYSKMNGDIKNKDTYKSINTDVRNHSVSFDNSKTKLPFKKKDHSSKCLHKKVKKNKQKMLKSNEENVLKKNDFRPSSSSFINSQTTLLNRIKSITKFHSKCLFSNEKKNTQKRCISIFSSRNDKILNPKDNISEKKWLPVEDDISSIIKNSLKTYMADNAAFFENNIRSTCIYESVGELDREKSKDSVLQKHDENIFTHKDGNKTYLESLLENAEIIDKKKKGSLKCPNQVKVHEIFNSEDFKNPLKRKKQSNNNIPKKIELNNFSGIKRNHIGSRKHFSCDTSNQNIKINKGCGLCYKKISSELHGRKIIMGIDKTVISCKKENNEIHFTYDMNKNSTSTLITKSINLPKNSFINNFIKFNLIKQMKNMKLLKSFSDSCVDLGKTSKFCCIKSRKNNINYSFHNCNHGTSLMETSTNLLKNNDEISVKKVDFMKFDSTVYCRDNKIYCNCINNRYQLKKFGKSYSNDCIKKTGMLKTFKQEKYMFEKCGDFDFVKKGHNFSKSEMSYIIYSCDGDKYTRKYEPNKVVDDNQYCFADPNLYYCDSELYLDNELPESIQCSPELKVESNYEILEHAMSTQSLNEGKEKLKLREEVFESHEGQVDTMVFQKQNCSLKLTKGKKHVSKKGIVNHENLEHWIRDIKKSESEQSIKSDNCLKQKQKTNSELSILSDYGLNCNSYKSNISDLNGRRPHTATTTRDVAVSAVCSGEDLRRSRSTIDKAIMCDEITKNEHKHIMQLHTNNIIIESSELIQLNGNGTSSFQSKDRELSTTITPTNEKFLKLELYQGESQTKYLEWHCNKVSNRSDHSLGTSQADFGNISNDEFFGQRDKGNKSKELEGIEFKNNFEYLCNEDNHSGQPKNLWNSFKTGSQKVFSFFQPIGPLRTCFKRNIF